MPLLTVELTVILWSVIVFHSSYFAAKLSNIKEWKKTMTGDNAQNGLIVVRSFLMATQHWVHTATHYILSKPWWMGWPCVMCWVLCPAERSIFDRWKISAPILRIRSSYAVRTFACSLSCVRKNLVFQKPFWFSLMTFIKPRISERRSCCCPSCHFLHGRSCPESRKSSIESNCQLFNNFQRFSSGKFPTPVSSWVL